MLNETLLHTLMTELDTATLSVIKRYFPTSNKEKSGLENPLEGQSYSPPLEKSFLEHAWQLELVALTKACAVPNNNQTTEYI